MKIEDCPELRVIQLMNNELTNLTVDRHGSKKLTELNLSGNNFRDVTSISLDTTFELQTLHLLDNNIQAQDLREIERLISFTKVNDLDLGCSEEGVRKGKRNNFFGSVDKLYHSRSSGKLLKLDISGTDIKEGLDHLLIH